jgi:DDE superfamily endonuclease
MDPDPDDVRRDMLAKCQLVSVTMAALLSIEEEEEEVTASERRGPTDKARTRVRRSVESIFLQYGPYYVRRAYRMDEEAFWKLHGYVAPLMVSTRTRPGSKTKTHKNGGKNGLISTSTRLSASIRYFAGGRPDDIAISHGIAHSEVFKSVWMVVDAVNNCPDLYFGFPACHEKQKSLAAAFKEKSVAGFDCCVGAIDGLLLWMEKPSKADCLKAQCGSKKFFCGRKHKFGLNLQGTCDAEGKFLDISIAHPASTSDFLAFATSDLQKQLEVKDFLAPGLCIFGDSAYVNNRYCITPFKNVKSGVRDSFNFYQSQIRINIECAFGMFVARWGLLRRALPQAMGIKKIVGLTLCLVRLHNFCIDNRASDERDKPLAAPLPADADEVLAQGGFGCDGNGADALLDGGNHNDDTTRPYRDSFVRNSIFDPQEISPRDRLLKMVEDGGFLRPLPKSWERESVAVTQPTQTPTQT